MPLWRIFSHPNTFNPTQRRAIAKAVTHLYGGLPAFYVVVLFIDLPDSDGSNPSCFVGGEANPNFVRIVVEQIARVMPSVESEEGRQKRKRWMDRINETLKPHIIDRSEINWELHIYETPRDLWRIQGMDPPPPNSEAEKEWFDKNMVVPYEVESL